MLLSEAKMHYSLRLLCIAAICAFGCFCSAEEVPVADDFTAKLKDNLNDFAKELRPAVSKALASYDSIVADLPLVTTTFTKFKAEEQMYTQYSTSIETELIPAKQEADEELKQVKNIEPMSSMLQVKIYTMEMELRNAEKVLKAYTYASDSFNFAKEQIIRAHFTVKDRKERTKEVIERIEGFNNNVERKNEYITESNKAEQFAQRAHREVQRAEKMLPRTVEATHAMEKIAREREPLIKSLRRLASDLSNMRQTYEGHEDTPNNHADTTGGSPMR